MPGTITFKPLEVNLLSDKSLFGKPDSYCIVSLGNQKVQTQITEKIEKDPQQKFYPILQVIDEPTCLVEVKDRENLDSSNRIGACEVSLDEIESKGCLKRWYSIYDQTDHPTGKILLEATFAQEDQTPTDLPASPKTQIMTPEDKLMTPDDDSEEDMRWTNNIRYGNANPPYFYKYSEQPDHFLDEQISPLELEFPIHKKSLKKKGRYSSYQKSLFDEDSDDSREEYKTDLVIDIQQYKPRLTVSYKSHPLEIGDESPTQVEKKSKSQEIKKSGTLKQNSLPENSKTPEMSNDNTFDLYHQIMGSRWDL